MKAVLNTRERFVRTLTGREVDRVPFMKIFGGTSQTIPSWLAARPNLRSYIDELLMFEGTYRGWNIAPVNCNICGAPPAVTVREDEHERVIRTGIGTVEVRRKADFGSHITEYPVKGWDEWLTIKKLYLDPTDARRFPPDWADFAEMYARRDYPLQLTGGGVYGFVRQMLGDEGVAYMFYDDPALVRDIMDTFTDMCIDIWGRMADDVQFDLIESWEDMAFKGGAMVSPGLFDEFLAPQFRKIRAFADSRGIPLVLVDSDGNIMELTAWMRGAGVNALYPFEAQAGNDVAAILDRFGDIGAIGGLDKNCMAVGPAAIEREMEKAEQLIKKGRFIPGPDHFVLSDVTFENYKYFMQRLRTVVLSTKPGN